MKLMSNFFPSRRRKPSRSEVGGMDLPPTPCPSIEEYVTPAFARNYQGVWKYVVQIPHEGYFTQTVQNIKCGRSRCEFTDGVCHESPRWVSLLVAEIYYPNHFYPSNKPAAAATHHKPYDTDMPPVEDFHNFQQYLKRRVGYQQHQGIQPPSMHIPGQYPIDYQRRGHQHGGRSTRQVNPSPKKATSTTASSPISEKSKKDKCDGHDQIGCYVVRMYYDWFLVNGSCKCWKPNARHALTSGAK